MGVEPWGNLPLWIPESAERHRYFLSANCERAFDAGLTFRAVADTARDTLAWQRAGSPGMDKDAPNSVQAHTLTPERERELLDAWRGENEGVGRQLLEGESS